MNTSQVDHFIQKMIAKRALEESIILDEQHSEILEDKQRLNKRAQELLKSQKDQNVWFSLGRNSFACFGKEQVERIFTAEEPETWKEVEQIQKRLPEKRRQHGQLEEELTEKLPDLFSTK
eukprot:jgi/Galph1/1802/GphlegSOOS_G475.1